MAKTTISRLTLRAENCQREQHIFWDYYVDNRRLSKALGVEGLQTPFGWLKPEAEERFAAMLMGKNESDFRPNRIPLFVCSLCADYGCGVFTCEVERLGTQIEWRNFGLEYDYDEDLRQDDCQRWSRFTFDATEYDQVFERFLGKREPARRPATAFEAPQPRTKKRKKR